MRFFAAFRSLELTFGELQRHMCRIMSLIMIIKENESSLSRIKLLSTQHNTTEEDPMNLSRTDVRRSFSSIPSLRFEDQELTSFSGLVLIQKLVDALNLKDRLRSCVRHLGTGGSYGSATILLLLIMHVTLGWRRLRDIAYYRSDPLVARLLGLRRLPNVSTVSRALQRFDGNVVVKLRNVVRDMALDRMAKSSLSRVTIDFDGSVISTKSRGTEGTAVGYNPKSKGSRSYYPLFATVAQSGQVFDVHHRPGNVHDSNGAPGFVEACFQAIAESGFSGVLEARLDGAHFSDVTVATLDGLGVEFSVSVPFLRFPDLKQLVAKYKRWRRIDDDWSYNEIMWKPKKWPNAMRCVLYRHRLAVPRKGPIQLDLFEPIERTFEYKVVATNKRVSPATLLRFHNGRGSQEGIFADLKSHLQLDYIPTRRLIGNQIWLLSGVLAHNLARELQIIAAPEQRRPSLSRACLWLFEKVDTLRYRLFQRAGRLTRPHGEITLTVSGDDTLRTEYDRYLKALDQAA